MPRRARPRNQQRQPRFCCFSPVLCLSHPPHWFGPLCKTYTSSTSEYTQPESGTFPFLALIQPPTCPIVAPYSLTVLPFSRHSLLPTAPFSFFVCLSSQYSIPQQICRLLDFWTSSPSSWHPGYPLPGVSEPASPPTPPAASTSTMSTSPPSRWRAGLLHRHQHRHHHDPPPQHPHPQLLHGPRHCGWDLQAQFLRREAYSNVSSISSADLSVGSTFSLSSCVIDHPPVSVAFHGRSSIVQALRWHPHFGSPPLTHVVG